MSDDFDGALSALGIAAPASAQRRPGRVEVFGVGNPKPNAEAQMRADAAFSPAEVARSNAFENSDGNRAMFERELANEKDPAKRAIMSAGYASNRTGQPAAPDTSDFDGALAMLNAPASAPAQAPAQRPLNANGVTPMVSPGTGPSNKIDPHAPISSPEFDLTANQVSGLASTVAGGIAGIGTGLYKLAQTGDVDQAVNAGANTVQKIQQAGTYQPRTETGAKMVDAFTSKYNPLNWIPNATAYVGEKAGGALADAGMPGAGAVVTGAGAAAPMALGLGVKPLSNMLKPAAEIAPRIEPTMSPPPLAEAIKPRYKMVNGQPVLIEQGAPPQTVAPTGGPVGQAPQGVPLSQVGKPTATGATPVPATPQAVQTMAQSAPAKLFPETPTVAPGEAGSKFTPAQQAERARILQSVGVDPNSMRTSALSGDAIGGSTDFQTAKVDSTAGRLMRAQLDNEKSALNDHASTLVKDTGGTTGVDQTSLYSRGNSIVAPLDSMKQWFDAKTSALYKAADERAQGVPTQLTSFKDVLADASHRTNQDRVLLPDAVSAYAKRLGMLDDEGNFSGTAQQAETLRKYLNDSWSPQNSGMVGKLKDALDNDVMSAAGSDIYGQARALRTQRANTLDNPKGIAQLMDSSGPQGINRAVSVEKIPDKLTGLSVDQFGHVVRTLKEAPPELQPQATAALSEIKAQFANKVQSIGSSQQGQWNAKGVTRYLQDNAARMSQVFTPEEIAKFRNLNDAGHILAKDQSYPGAAIQGHNLATQGLMYGVQGGGAALGSTLGGPIGGAVGGLAGRAAANAIGDASSVRAVKKRMTKLSDLAPRQ